jgi:hypothetical protein
MRLRHIASGIAGLAMLALPGAVLAQTNPAQNITSVVRGGVVVVSYDLVSADSAAVFSVALEASADGGKTYGVQPKTVQGDVGQGVRAGQGKQITWEASRDVEILLDRLRYRVVAQPLKAQAASPQPPRPGGEPVVTPAATSSKGKGHLWGGLAMIGGGAFLAISSMTTMKNVDYETNTPLLWTGLGLAGGGIAVAALGGGNSSVGTAVVFRPGGVAVQHRMPIRLPF